MTRNINSNTYRKVESEHIFFSIFNKIKLLYFKSVKPFHTEELIGTFFFRPLGFLIAMLSKIMHVSPNILSIIRGILGLCGGVLFYIATPGSVFFGAIILLFSQMFDFADGQLARILEKSTRLGVILDGVGDGIALTAVYLGTAFVLFKRNPGTGPYWWILTIIAFICLFIHIYTQGFLRYEFFLYTSKDKTIYSAKGLQDARVTLPDLRKKMKAEKNLWVKFSIGIMMAFNSGLNLASGIVLIKKYKGYFDFYKNTDTLSKEKMELFRGNYKKYNGWILLVLNNLGLISNQMIFIIAGLFNRLDLALYILLFGSNLYFLICVIIQRISFKIQLNKIK